MTPGTININPLTANFNRFQTFVKPEKFRNTLSSICCMCNY